MTILLNKMGILLFAYLNSMIVAWLVVQRKRSELAFQISIENCDRGIAAWFGSSLLAQSGGWENDQVYANTVCSAIG